MAIVKNHCEMMKKALDSSLKFFVFKSILVVLLCFLIVCYFFIIGQILNCLSTDIIITKFFFVKIQKRPLRSVLVFFASNNILVVLLYN